MKKWIVIVLSLVLVILSSYFVMGYFVEKTLKKNLSSIPKNPVFNFNMDKYQRGWFSSDGLLAIKMHVPEHASSDNGAITPAVDFDLSFPLIINHGPVIFTDYGIRFGMGQVSTHPQTHYHALINYCNKIVVNYSFPSFNIKGKSTVGDFNLEWLGIKANLIVSATLDALKGDFTLYGLSGSVSDTVFKLGEVLNDFDLERGAYGLWLGYTHFALPSLAIASSQKKFTLEGFDLEFKSSLDNDLLSFDYAVSLQKLVIEEKTYGPSFVKMSIKNLDPVAMANINQLGLEMAQNQQDPNQILSKFLFDLPKLLSKAQKSSSAIFRSICPRVKLLAG